MLSANINRNRITQADIHTLAVASEKDERNTKPLFKDESNTKLNSISIDSSFIISNFIAGVALCCGISFDFTVILDVTSGDTFIKLLAIMQ